MQPVELAVRRRAIPAEFNQPAERNHRGSDAEMLEQRDDNHSPGEARHQAAFDGKQQNHRQQRSQADLRQFPIGEEDLIRFTGKIPEQQARILGSQRLKHLSGLLWRRGKHPVHGAEIFGRDKDHEQAAHNQTAGYERRGSVPVHRHTISVYRARRLQAAFRPDQTVAPPAAAVGTSAFATGCYTFLREVCMRLLAKFNLILVALFGAGSILIGYAARQFLMRDARNQVIQQAELMIESARSTRRYTANDVAPLLEQLPAHRERFLPETIPFYAATVTFDYLRKTYPAYTYKEAALNPTNLRDRAVDWEADLIDYFRNHKNSTELVGERDTPTGRMLYIAHPIATEQACLQCHSEPSQAPAAILRTYGSANGFGWGANETVAAQIVSVPMSVPIQIANNAFRTLVIYLIAGFLITIAALDAAMVFIVIRPVRQLSAMADRISTGDMSLPELPVHGRDEIAALTASFNRMFVSLQKAFRMLNG